MELGEFRTRFIRTTEARLAHVDAKILAARERYDAAVHDLDGYSDEAARAAQDDVRRLARERVRLQDRSTYLRGLENAQQGGQVRVPEGAAA